MGAGRLDKKIKPENMNDDAVKNLLSAIVFQAVKDYKTALYNFNTQKLKSKKFDAKNTIGECEWFFRQNLSTYCDLDGEKVISLIRLQVKKKLDKKKIKMEVPKFDRRRII